MLAGPPKYEQLDASRVRSDVQARRRTSLEPEDELPGWVDRAAARQASSACAHDIRIDRSHRIQAAGGERDGHRARGALILAVSAGSVGLALAGLLSGYFAFRPEPPSSTVAAQGPAPSAGIANAIKGDRLPVHQTDARQAHPETSAKPPHGPNPVSSVAIARRTSSPAVVPSAPSAADHLPAVQPRAASTTDSAAKPHTEARLVAVPDTRPTTIDGWTLREVVDGTAVLEGPDGIRRARRGDTVPGVGKVVAIIRWGNRLIVATSKGLISTR